MYALSLNADNRILSAWVVLPDGNYDGMPLVDVLPEGNLYEYRYENGGYIHDPLPQPEPVPEEDIWDELENAYREGVDSL